MTVTAAFPTVIAAVMSVATTALPDARVVRGRDISKSADDVVMVGTASLDDSPGWDSAGTFNQDFQTFGGGRSESGTVNGVVYSRSGDADQDEATSDAFALIAGLGAAIRADVTLGVAAFDYLVAQFQTGDIREQQNDEGAVTEIAFAIQYDARI